LKGLGSKSYPIEVGVALASGQTYCSLIQPDPKWTYWDEGAEKIHRVPRDILEVYGKPIAEVAHQLNALLGDQAAFSDGWEVDQPWLSQLFYTSRIPQGFRFSTLEFILSPQQMASWHEKKDEIIQEMDLKRHRASLDALAIQQTYVRTREC